MSLDRRKQVGVGVLVDPLRARRHFAVRFRDRILEIGRVVDVRLVGPEVRPPPVANSADSTDLAIENEE